jgi:hypothetical protein
MRIPREQTGAEGTLVIGEGGLESKILGESRVQ